MSSTPRSLSHLNGFAQATQEIQRHSARAISIITWMEVLAGANDATESGVRNLLALFTILQLTPQIAERAIVIRRRKRLKLPDAIILATCEVEGRVLVSRNTKDFPEGPGIHVPYRL